jgi:hypothetical protein
MQAEKIIKDKVNFYQAKCVVFFGLFKEAFGKSDKKTFKDNLSPFFGTNEICGEFMKS